MKLKSVLDKRFPTLIGLLVLFGALGAGVFFIGSGPGIFTPRATPQTTPKSVKVTNITDTTFTVSFITDETTSAFINYGTSATSLKSQGTDDRDQLAGNVGTYNTHHITLRNLQANTTYFFTLGTGSNAQFDNNGKPYSIKTGSKSGSQSLAQTIYGSVLNKNSTPADGSIVYVTVDKAGELSTLVRSTGVWAVPLSQLRAPDGGNPPEVNTNTLMQIFVQGKNAADTTTLTTTVGQPQFPVKTLTLGEVNSGGNSSAAPTNTPAANPTQTAGGTTPTVTASAGTNNQPVVTASGSATPTKAVTKSPTPKITATIRPTATEEVSLPATDSPKPISGSSENTVIIFVAGILLISFGSVLYLSFRK